ncbi:TetR/AcrR family transcriptional regulator [Roseococcus sp. MDT2-1-1]|uniref:TetR/AcrR family transcriptional regulator n=1 Tax=Sabulicella glaciei TaxID=2984948 RepID=A0ABT3P0A6_9PROT|nr:TetR/AcrR family transcriptional regulator [Roseococcus sp. MDT2-1-1]MCW8087608.1 TetR/AcrR family transcriptional regulator [Roseococcus sp. MDT2-1-1]
MARPRLFDEGAALDAAMNVFWRHGYAATSVRDLCAATGLGPPSLYNAFGDKQALFARCLDRYLDENTLARIRRAEAHQPPRLALERFLSAVAERSIADNRGCLLVNTALEVAPHEPAIGSVVAERLGEIESFFFRCVEAGQREGSVSRERAPEDLARLLLAVVMGMRVLARARPDAALLQGALQQALSLLGTPTPEARP